MLVRQGEATMKVLVIRSGVVKCYITEDNDKEFILEFLGEGEVVGELEAIGRRPAMCNVQTLSEVAVYLIDKPTFLDLLGSILRSMRPSWSSWLCGSPIPLLGRPGSNCIHWTIV